MCSLVTLFDFCLQKLLFIKIFTHPNMPHQMVSGRKALSRTQGHYNTQGDCQDCPEAIKSSQKITRTKITVCILIRKLNIKIHI